MPSNYLEKVGARRWPTSEVDDVSRGLQAGKSIGQALGGFATAIQNARKEQLANQLMDEQDISNQPGAGVEQSLGKLDDGSGGSDGASSGSSGGGPQDLGTLPPDTTFTNPSTGDIEPLQNPASDADFSQAIAASRLGSGQTVGALNQAIAANRLVSPASSGDDFTLNSSDYAGRGGKTVGSLVHTGGTQEMDLRAEMMKQQIQKASAARAQVKDAADMADRQAEATGTGRYALDTAAKRVKLAQAQADLQQTLHPAAKTTTKEVKNPAAVSIGSEPVIDQAQLNRHIDSIYGSGVASGMAGTLASNDPAVAPVLTDDSVTFTVGNKKISIPKAEAQTYGQQFNALRLRQGLPAYRLPWEDQTLGASAANPYPAKTNLDVFSRAPGTWIRLPNNRLTQVPERKQ